MRKTADTKAPRNRTLFLTQEDKIRLKPRLIEVNNTVSLSQVVNHTINQNLFDVLDLLPENSVDLLFTDPPYNISKTFNDRSFKQLDIDEYQNWLDQWISKLPRLLKQTASFYICGDWRSSPCIFYTLRKYFKIRNRITFEREKGRGAKTNWKNSHEDIWFCTVSDSYTFNVDAVKVKKKVIAPYTDQKGKPKDWNETADGRFRITHPSNLWTDITIPYWSMPENTDHPTQKPEKLLAKIILASSNPDDLVFDPFLGSGTTSVVAKKLGRRFFGVEIDELYSLLAERRLELAESDQSIQGYSDGLFWERNSLNFQKIGKPNNSKLNKIPSLFE